MCLPSSNYHFPPLCFNAPPLLSLLSPHFQTKIVQNYFQNILFMCCFNLTSFPGSATDSCFLPVLPLHSPLFSCSLNQLLTITIIISTNIHVPVNHEASNSVTICALITLWKIEIGVLRTMFMIPNYCTFI